VHGMASNKWPTFCSWNAPVALSVMVVNVT
jgi:hypothetical protein